MGVPERYDWDVADLEDLSVDAEQMEQWDVLEQQLQQDERHRYECQKCAAARDVAVEMSDITYGGPDPELDSAAHPITLREDESIGDVFDRDEDDTYVNFDAADFTRLQRTGEHDGLYLRTVSCETHETVTVSYVGEGKGEIENGRLCPVLYVSV